MIHQPVSVVSQCVAGASLNGLASGDQRRLTGSSNALRPVYRDAIHSTQLDVELSCVGGSLETLQRRVELS